MDKLYTFTMELPGYNESYTRVEFIILNNDIIISHGTLDIYESITHITWLYTTKKHRGRGLAEQILDEMYKVSKEYDCTEIKLVVDFSLNQPFLIKYYKKRGFNIELCNRGNDKCMTKKIY